MLIVINCKKDEGKYTLFTASLDLRDSKENREKKKAARNPGVEERGHFFWQFSLESRMTDQSLEGVVVVYCWFISCYHCDFVWSLSVTKLINN